MIFGSPDSEPVEARPADFPYWENITQRRYEGPSVIYLGAGWAMTARHVGIGEIFLDGEIFAPNVRSRHILLNDDGTAADAIVFRLDSDANLPDLPILPLARLSPLPGEELLIIGFGRGRQKVIEWDDAGVTRFAFEWSERGSKRWGTNIIFSTDARLPHRNGSTRALSFVFDPPDGEDATRHEVQATLGDSGGAVFVKRDGEWRLAGMMTSISSNSGMPEQTTTYGDITFAADISFYRDEIVRWARPKCSNEKDDDGDGKIDFPLDPGCASPGDPDERDTDPIAGAIGIPWPAALAGSAALAVMSFLVFGTIRRR